MRRRGADNHQDPGSPDLVRRCAAACSPRSAARSLRPPGVADFRSLIDFGAGPAKVHLSVKSDWSLKTLYDVIAKLPGTTEADQWVIRGNHHDAWVNGAEDPISGLVAELEEARAMGALYKQGWRPKRTIIYAAWDGEEPGLLGSTEWAETHADELKAHAVAYLNSDTNGRGYLGVSGSHSLEKFINGVAMDVKDPEAGVSSWKRLQASRILHGSADARRDARDREDLRIGALGSGSDYSSFIDHLGIASLNLGYGGEDDGGIYHSVYDDFYWFTHFSDTAFVYGRALAQTAGTAVLRLANADLLPFGFTNLAETVQGYVKDLQSLRDRRAEQITERNRQIDEGLYKFTSDPRIPVIAPERQSPPPQLNFAPLLNAVDSLNHAASRYEKAYTSAVQPEGGRRARNVNTRLTPGRAGAHVYGRSEKQAVVRAHALRARLLHWLRCEDDSRRPRGNRARAVGGCRPRDRARCCGGRA